MKGVALFWAWFKAAERSCPVARANEFARATLSMRQGGCDRMSTIESDRATCTEPALMSHEDNNIQQKRQIRAPRCQAALDHLKASTSLGNPASTRLTEANHFHRIFRFVTKYTVLRIDTASPHATIQGSLVQHDTNLVSIGVKLTSRHAAAGRSG
jgi:hypothetical protein